MNWLFGQYLFGKDGIAGFVGQIYPCEFKFIETPQATNDD